jgi:hypothetical protein
MHTIIDYIWPRMTMNIMLASHNTPAMPVRHAADGGLCVVVVVGSAIIMLLHKTAFRCASSNRITDNRQSTP